MPIEHRWKKEREVKFKIYSFEALIARYKKKTIEKGGLLLKAVIARASTRPFILLLFDRPTIYPHGVTIRPPCVCLC